MASGARSRHEAAPAHPREPEARHRVRAFLLPRGRHRPDARVRSRRGLGRCGVRLRRHPVRLGRRLDVPAVGGRGASGQGADPDGAGPVPAAEAHRIGLVNRSCRATSSTTRRCRSRTNREERTVRRADDEGVDHRVWQVAGLRAALDANTELDVMIETANLPARDEFRRITQEEGLKAAIAWRDARYRGHRVSTASRRRWAGGSLFLWAAISGRRIGSGRTVVVAQVAAAPPGDPPRSWSFGPTSSGSRRSRRGSSRTAFLGAAAFATLYKGLQLGPIAVVSPVLATAAAVPVLLVGRAPRRDARRGGRWSALPVTIAGAAFTSTDPKALRAGTRHPSQPGCRGRSCPRSCSAWRPTSWAGRPRRPASSPSLWFGRG